MVQAIHTAVAGRARFKVEGLYRSKSLEKLLESRLVRLKDISQASANALTGNVLVCYNSGNTPANHCCLNRRDRLRVPEPIPTGLASPVLHQAQAAPEGEDQATVLGRFKGLFAYPAEQPAKPRSGWEIFFSQVNSLPVAVHA